MELKIASLKDLVETISRSETGDSANHAKNSGRLELVTGKNFRTDSKRKLLSAIRTANDVEFQYRGANIDYEETPLGKRITEKGRQQVAEILSKEPEQLSRDRELVDLLSPQLKSTLSFVEALLAFHEELDIKLGTKLDDKDDVIGHRHLTTEDGYNIDVENGLSCKGDESVSFTRFIVTSPDGVTFNSIDRLHEAAPEVHIYGNPFQRRSDDPNEKAISVEYGEFAPMNQAMLDDTNLRTVFLDLDYS